MSPPGLVCAHGEIPRVEPLLRPLQSWVQHQQRLAAGSPDRLRRVLQLAWDVGKFHEVLSHPAEEPLGERAPQNTHLRMIGCAEDVKPVAGEDDRARVCSRRSIAVTQGDTACGLSEDIEAGQGPLRPPVLAQLLDQLAAGAVGAAGPGPVGLGQRIEPQMREFDILVNPRLRGGAVEELGCRIEAVDRRIEQRDIVRNSGRLTACMTLDLVSRSTGPPVGQRVALCLGGQLVVSLSQALKDLIDHLIIDRQCNPLPTSMRVAVQPPGARPSVAGPPGPGLAERRRRPAGASDPSRQRRPCCDRRPDWRRSVDRRSDRPRRRGPPRSSARA